MSDNPHVIARTEVLFGYTVSRDGKIWSLKSKKYLKYADNTYYYIVLRNHANKRCNFAIHRIVAETYVPNSFGYKVVNHIDGNKYNNCVENLEWCTQQENSLHSYFLNTRNKMTKSVIQMNLKGVIIKEFDSAEIAASQISVPRSTIQNICLGKSIASCKYHFVYKKDLDNIDRKVNKIDPKSRSILYTFKNAKDAADSIDMPTNFVLKCCNNPLIKYKGFLWQYVTDEEDNKPLPNINFKNGSYKRIEIDREIVKGYYVRNDGKIWSEKQKRFLIPSLNAKYYDQTVKHNGKNRRTRIHRMVARAFVPNANPRKFTIVNHKNGNKLDNRFENLEWCTHRRNSKHAHKNKLIKVYKRPVVQFDMKGTKMADYVSINDASLVTSTRRTDIIAACKGRQISAGKYIWKYKEDEKDVITGNIELHYKRKGVVKFDMQCNKICEYHSTKEAAKEFSCNAGDIAAACRGAAESSHGYLWRYKGEEHTVKPKTIKPHYKQKIVVQFDLDGNRIQEFPSIQNAAKNTNTPAGAISKCCLRQQESCNGFIWVYKEDDDFILIETKVISCRAKRVAKCDKDTGETLQEYDSATAVEKEGGGFNRRSVCDACLGNTKLGLYKGFIWKYI
jgi:hypothetical protein